MQVFTTNQDYYDWQQLQRKHHRQIAFVPTLGALHEGHLALIDQASALGDLVVVSIFVNPTQFNDPADLEKYPRPLRMDIHLLTQKDVDVLYLPLDEEVYPPHADMNVSFDGGTLVEVMEGAHRPGHFDGVITVVHRLLRIIQPQYLIMGQKDFQQKTIIDHMIRHLQMPVELVIHPIVREDDGLALSSRNVRLDPNLRKDAPALYQSLMMAKQMSSNSTPAEVINACKSMLEETPFRLEYFNIVDENTLLPVQSWPVKSRAVACVAAWLGAVRLIDNMVLTEGK